MMQTLAHLFLSNWYNIYAAETIFFYGYGFNNFTSNFNLK